MRVTSRFGFFAPLTVLACATSVTPDLADSSSDGDGGSGGTQSIPDGGKPSGGKPSGGSSNATSGSGPKAFGGTTTTGGSDSGEGGEGGGGADVGGGGGMATAGSGGKAGSGGSGGKAGASSGGSGGAATGGSGGGGKAGAGGGGGSGGTTVGPGDCSGTAAWSMGAGNKYMDGAKVVATCNGGTPCTLAMPPLQQGETYEFSCRDQYNCGTVNPASTNWSSPPWVVVRACE